MARLRAAAPTDREMKRKSGTPEVRFGQIVGLEFRDAPDGSSSPGGFRGYAAVYDSPSVPLPGPNGRQFREYIAPGAFDAALAADDVRALINHDPNLVLARSKAGEGTMQLSSDERGLLVDIPELPDTSYARDLLESLKRGDVDQMSFGFVTVRDSWGKGDDGMDERTLEEARLFDVSPVTFPAYPDTIAEARTLADALAELREGKVLSQKNHETISGVVEALSSLLEDATPDTDVTWEYNAARNEHGLRALVGENRDGSTIAALGWIIGYCEDFVAYYADDDEDKAAMQKLIADLEAMVAVEAAPDADDEARSGKSSAVDLLRLRALAVELGATKNTTTEGAS